MVCIRSRNPAELTHRLMARDIVTSHRDQSIRATVHFYNNEDDIDALAAALKDLRADLR